MLIRLQLSRIGGGLLGAVPAFLLARSLEALPSSLLTAILLAGGAVLSGRRVAPWRWWLGIGAATGSLLGTAEQLALSVKVSPTPLSPGHRLAMVGLLVVAGSIAGHSFSRDADRHDRRPPRETLRSASALTTGLFAALVSVTFLLEGLDPARTLSSRLSTSLTILITSLTAPGWLAHLLSAPGRRPSVRQRKGE